MTTATRTESSVPNLVGSWGLVACQSIGQDGTVGYPLGTDAAGQLMYDASGRMSVHIVRADQPRFSRADWQQASVEEMCTAWPNYFGYFGRFTLDGEAGVITHHIEGSWFPNLVGTDHVRRFHFEDDSLILDADTDWGTVRNIWQTSTRP